MYEFLFTLYTAKLRSRVGLGSIVPDYGLDDQVIGVRSPAGAKDFSFILCVQTGSAAHPASCTMGTGGPFPGGKSAAKAWRWLLTPIQCRGREWVGAKPPLPPSASMACSRTALPFILPNCFHFAPWAIFEILMFPFLDLRTCSTTTCNE
jgi:hypothetical protein